MAIADRDTIIPQRRGSCRQDHMHKAPARFHSAPPTAAPFCAEYVDQTVLYDVFNISLPISVAPASCPAGKGIASILAARFAMLAAQVRLAITVAANLQHIRFLTTEALQVGRASIISAVGTGGSADGRAARRGDARGAGRRREHERGRRHGVRAQ